MLRVRAGDYFAGNPAYYAGATDTNRCTICDDTSMEGGWAHTLLSCFDPVVKCMRINWHNMYVRMVRDVRSTDGIAGGGVAYTTATTNRADMPA